MPKSLHQDGYYFEHKLQSPTAVLSYAVDVDMGNAPLYVVPGSHELGLVRHEDDRWAGFALNDPVWWERAVPIEGRAGDAVIFHTCTIHGSPDNRSDRPRPVFIKRYRRADDFCVIDVANVADRQRAEQAPVTAKTEDDWGLMVRGIRRYQPAEGIDEIGNVAVTVRLRSRRSCIGFNASGDDALVAVRAVVMRNACGQEGLSHQGTTREHRVLMCRPVRCQPVHHHGSGWGGAAWRIQTGDWRWISAEVTPGAGGRWRRWRWWRRVTPSACRGPATAHYAVVQCRRTKSTVGASTRS